MKFTLSWLKEHLDTDEPLEKLADRLTMIGLEVEHIEDKAKALAAFSIARVISAEQHPNADRLRVCMVDTGNGAAPVQVVCGAPNARAGLISVFSPPGTFIPGKNITLGVGTIRGVESRGMLCSAAELQISEDHDGIMELPADAPVGAGYAAWAGLGDPMIEINLTPNRQDCTGVHGIARDLSAADMGKFKDPGIKQIKGEFPCPVKVTVEDATLCPGFALRLVRGVKNGPSPEWLQQRLTSIGLRPINALVDITNFMTYDRARPLHVFDAKKVKGNLTVRRARDGETLLALDGRTYTLDPNVCVIADDHGVESLAGIMGGEASGCDENTTDVLIESALWNEINIAQSGRKLGINSDARYRFERGVDPAFMLPGLELATKLVMELCGGKPSENVVVGDSFGDDRIIDFPLSEVRRLAGIEVPFAEMKRILNHLGFMVAGSGAVVKVAVPSWRTDVHGKADIVEEIVRIVGVDKVPMTPFERGDAPRKPILTAIQLRTRRAKRALAARGMVEAVTWSFIAKPAAEVFGGGQPELALANPIASDLSDMRPSLLPGLIAAAQANNDRGFADVALFEVGQIFKGDKPSDQFIAAAGIRHGFASGKGMGRSWSGSATADAFDAKADAFAVLSAAGAPMQALQIVPGGPNWLHPGRSGTIQIGPQNILGYFGELHPRALEALDADGPLIAFEAILDRIPDAKQKPTRAKPVLELSAFQPVSRDFAFIVDRKVKAGDIVRAAQGVDKKLITAVNVFDVYEGKGIDDDKKSIAIAVTIQPREKTMTDQEIDAVGARIVAEVTKKTGGSLRGMSLRVAPIDAPFPCGGDEPFELIPADVTTNAVLAICVIAFISGTARGFSGFGAAMIFMPLASSVAGPRLVASLLLVIDFIAAAPLLPNAWKQADRKATAVMAIGTLAGVPLGTWCLSQFDPVTTRWIISCFVGALLLLLLSGWRYRGKDYAGLSIGIGGLAGFCSGLAQTGGPPIVGYWLGRPIASVIARANILLFFGFSDGVSLISYIVAGLVTSDSIRLGILVGPVYAIGVWFGSQLFGRASETLFRAICYALIAAAAIIGLPALDGIVR